MILSEQRFKATCRKAAAVLLLTAGILLALTEPASAHSGDIAGGCDRFGSHVYTNPSLSNFPAGSTVSITLDGVLEPTVTFGSTTYTYDHLLDPYAAHTWSAAVDSGGDGPGPFDATYGGEIPVCKTAPAPTTTTKTCSDNFQSGLPRCTALVIPTPVEPACGLSAGYVWSEGRCPVQVQAVPAVAPTTPAPTTAVLQGAAPADAPAVLAFTGLGFYTVTAIYAGLVLLASGALLVAAARWNARGAR